MNEYSIPHEFTTKTTPPGSVSLGSAPWAIGAHKFGCLAEHLELLGRSTPCIGDKVIQPLIGNPYNGYINPYGIGLMTIPYYTEIMGV